MVASYQRIMLLKTFHNLSDYNTHRPENQANDFEKVYVAARKASKEYTLCK